MVPGKRSGIAWEIDAKGIGENDEIFFIVECRRYTTSRQSQEKVGSLAYRILDTGAKGGIVVSPLGMQEGASKIAQAETIYNVILDADSTTTEYILRFLEKTRYGKKLEGRLPYKGTLHAMLIHKDGSVEDLGEL